jgi:hypothetical protein
MFVSKKILVIIAVVLLIGAVVYFVTRRKGSKEKYSDSEGERLTIKNTCGVPVQIADIAFPRGDGIKCPKMKTLAPGAKVVFNDFVPYDDVVIVKSSKAPNSGSFVRIGSLREVVGNEKDIGKGCSKLMKAGGHGVYSVEPGQSSLSLCRKR